jgi:Cu(I)/Ag(I) efflux system membrane fusion protein
VYLNNSNLKFPIGLRLQVLLKQIPFILGSEATLVSIGSKSSFIKKENGFKAREIKTGIELNDFIQVEGLGVKEQY